MTRTLAVALLAVLGFTGCMDNNEPQTPSKSTLIVSKADLALSGTSPQDSTLVFLDCGCHFNLVEEAYTGDTSVIHAAQYDASVSSHRVGLRFVADTNVAAGTYHATLAFLSTGNKGDYRDTVHVTYTR